MKVEGGRRRGRVGGGSECRGNRWGKSEGEWEKREVVKVEGKREGKRWRLWVRMEREWEEVKRGEEVEKGEEVKGGGRRRWRKRRMEGEEEKVERGEGG